MDEIVRLGQTSQAPANLRATYRVVIVDYGKAAAVTTLLSQLALQTLQPESVAVLDNAPSPRSDEAINAALELPFHVDYQHFPENIGYSRACNTGAKGESTFLLFLNPDIEFVSTETMRDVIDQVLALGIDGPVGVSQRNPDGTFEVVARRVPTLGAIIARRVPALAPLFTTSVQRYTAAYANEHTVGHAPIEPAEWLQSSFLLVPRSTWKQVGPFDERYFVFMADVDFGLRCWNAGKPSHLLRNHCIAADGLRSSRGGVLDIFRSRSLRIHLRDALKFFLCSPRLRS